MKRLYISAALVLFVGCSSKKYYEPKVINSYENLKFIDNKTYNLNKVIYSNNEFASFKDGYFIDKYNNKYNLPKGFVALNKTTFTDFKFDVISNGKKFHFNKLVASANKIGNYLVVVFQDNSFKVLDFNSKKVLVKDNFSKGILYQTTQAFPIGYNDLIIIPTLDGSLYIMQNLKHIKSFDLSNKDMFNNIVYLKVINSTIIAMTKYKIFSFSNNGLFEKEGNFRYILNDNDKLYIFQNDGTILVTDLFLKPIKSLKLNFAHFIKPIIIENNLIVVDKDGYIIKLDKNTLKVLKNIKVWNYFSNDFNFLTKDTLYVGRFEVKYE